MPPKVNIKGIREGLLVTLGDGEWPNIQDDFIEYIDDQLEFLRGARLALDVGNHILHAAELGHLRDELAERDLTLWAVISDSPTTEHNAQTFGLATRISKPLPDRTTKPLETALQGEQAVLVRRTMRSGQSLKHPGHVVVIGDVNPGAEIIAGGNVVVWGRLRGMVHAGAQGDRKVVVCALDLSPTQLRISDIINITPPRKEKPQPEIARILDGRVVAEPWESWKK